MTYITWGLQTPTRSQLHFLTRELLESARKPEFLDEAEKHSENNSPEPRASL